MNTLLLRQQQLQTWINENTDFECKQLEMVSGDASFRRYFRFSSKGQSIIAVDAPPEFEDSSKFILMAQCYHAAGIHVPLVYAHNFEQGFYCQQDFGDRQFSQALNEQSCEALYTRALDIIPVIQTCCATESGELPLYDYAFVQRELNIFSEWLLKEYLEYNLSSGQSSLIKDTFSELTDTFLAQPMVGVHRDFHSRNLMLIEHEQIGVIDFQDAVIGPVTYDAVSLLRDCYQSWPADKVERWLHAWHSKFYEQYEWPTFKRWFDLTGMQRHIKASGIFARLHLRDNKSVYLRDIPRTLKYIVTVGALYPELQAFSEFIAQDILPLVKIKQKD
ncbi:phosphotransferase [Paraglaciecola aquimarina]|uniref:Phosphotransferase n=1 Tax=Paraglaciecola aquimarina TaxID=1235557 RepID=A0ABU3SW69_9ALTE|nr:phosphotransferase [Paraglaciecola aquimarina]MDU0354227.1 phosphotransferase [Paraglaciecola aquimarina]